MVIEIPRSLAAARDGTVGAACIDAQRGGYARGVFVPLMSALRRKVDDISLLKVIRSSSFDPVFSLIACRPSFEVHRAGVDPV